MPFLPIVRYRLPSPYIYLMPLYKSNSFSSKTSSSTDVCRGSSRLFKIQFYCSSSSSQLRIADCVVLIAPNVSFKKRLWLIVDESKRQNGLPNIWYTLERIQSISHQVKLNLLWLMSDGNLNWMHHSNRGYADDSGSVCGSSTTSSPPLSPMSPSPSLASSNDSGKFNSYQNERSTLSSFHPLPTHQIMNA